MRGSLIINQKQFLDEAKSARIREKTVSEDLITDRKPFIRTQSLRKCLQDTTVARIVACHSSSVHTARRTYSNALRRFFHRYAKFRNLG